MSRYYRSLAETVIMCFGYQVIIGTAKDRYGRKKTATLNSKKFLTAGWYYKTKGE